MKRVEEIGWNEVLIFSWIYQDANALVANRRGSFLCVFYSRYEFSAKQAQRMDARMRDAHKLLFSLLTHAFVHVSLFFPLAWETMNWR